MLQTLEEKSLQKQRLDIRNTYQRNVHYNPLSPMNLTKDWVLITWTIASLILDIFLLGGAYHIVFNRGGSGWWFVLAIFLASSTTYFKVMGKRYDLKED